MSGFLSSLYIYIGHQLSVRFGVDENRFPFFGIFMVFSVLHIFCFTRSHLLIVVLNASAISVLFKKLSPMSLSPTKTLNYLFIRQSVFGVVLIYLIYLDLSFVQGDRYGSVCILLYADIKSDQHHFLKMLSFFQCIFLAYVLCTGLHMYMDLCIFFNSIDQLVFSCQYHAIYTPIALQQSL